MIRQEYLKGFQEVRVGFESPRLRHFGSRAEGAPRGAALAPGRFAPEPCGLKFELRSSPPFGSRAHGRSAWAA